MLSCIACAKHDPDGGGEEGGGRPTGKEPVKSLSSQVTHSFFVLINSIVASLARLLNKQFIY